MDGVEGREAIRMLKVAPESRPGEPLRLLCIGAHSDDLEIGCAGTVLTWLGAPCSRDYLGCIECRSRERRRGTPEREAAP